jgi:RNA polymerase sigma factor (TIGR02999 family)
MTPGAPVPSGRDITELLLAMSDGDAAAFNELVPLVHVELRRLARRQMRRERDGHTLQTTALVNEAYMRLIDLSRASFHGRSHFFAMSARIMRRILVDHARSRGYSKRGGGARLTTIDDATAVAVSKPADLVALDEALATLAASDPRKANVVELRFFGGMTTDETAAVLGVSAETVKRDWRIAKAWLRRELDRTTS